MSGQKQIEQLLIDAGYIEEVEHVAAENDLPLGTGANRHLDFLTKQKPWAAERVAVQAMEARRPIPESVVALARKLQALPGIGNQAAAKADET